MGFCGFVSERFLGFFAGAHCDNPQACHCPDLCSLQVNSFPINNENTRQLNVCMSAEKVITTGDLWLYH